MADVFEHRVTRGAVRVVRRWEPEEGLTRPVGEWAGSGGGSNAGKAGPSTAGRIQATFSPRMRRSMRYEFSALPWELLGRRPVLATFTMPAVWRSLCPDARALDRMRKALYGAWKYRYGQPIGVWVVEFQPRKRRIPSERNAPHLHVYIGLPEEVSDEEFSGLLRRTFDRKRLERKYGKYDGRARVEAIRGEFSSWLLEKWADIVGSDGWQHRFRGVDITPAFWSELAEATANRTRIAEYFWRESGKFGQKIPPEGFGGLAFYGRWGTRAGFAPVEGRRVVSEDVAYILRREYRRYIQTKMERRYRGPRGRDGLTAFVDDGIGFGSRMEEWAGMEVVRKASLSASERRSERGVPRTMRKWSA